jgi:hypothetical protein
MRILIFAFAVAACGGGGESLGECEGEPCCLVDSQCPTDLEFPLFCLAPHANPGCGFCPQPTCVDDAQCAMTNPGTICDNPCRDNFCDAGDCVPGCATTGCDGEAQVCDATTNRCIATSCTGDGDCPVDFGCSPAGACVRKTCDDSNDCDAFCVGGACYQIAGSCRETPV